MKLNWISKYAILIIALLCIVSRIPQLLSDNLILDGDEAIVGLMSKHFLELKEIPFFFYGQSYGFSFLEVLTIRVFYSIFGISEIAVKLAMLTLWSTGIIFFYKTLKAIGFKNNPWIPLLITLVFIFSPSFAVWSMKARGGYLTSFVLTSIVTFLLFNNRQQFNLYVSFSIGFLLVVIYQSQGLWLAGLLPIVAYTVINNRNIRYGILMFTGLFVGSLTFYFLKMGLPTFWSPKILGWPTLSVQHISNMSELLYIHFTGNYFYGDFKESIFITKLLSLGMISVIFASLITGILFFIKKKDINPVFYILMISVLCSFGYIIFISWLGARYYLPITGFALLMIAFLISQFKNKKAINIILIIWISFGAYSLYDFKNYSYLDKPALIELVNELETKNISHVYCEGALLQWQISFYSKEKTISRYTSNIDRYPKYIQWVDAAFKENNNHTALVGYYKEELEESLPNFTPIQKTFFIVTPVMGEYLIERGFDLTEP